MEITFCGAAESVTGSCHLIETTYNETQIRFLLDCGLFQGSSKQEVQNYEPFPFKPEQIDFLILSHAHIDHCGRIPLLVKEGFHGRIYCTDATADLLPIMLRDSAHIHEKEAEWKNRKGQRSGKDPVTPLYTSEDAEAALAFVTPILYEHEVVPAEGIRFSFVDAGHLLGSAITEVWVREGENGEETKLVYSGDIGQAARPLLRDPVKVKKADIVIMETTYGARLHEKSDASVELLAIIIERTIGRGGNVVIPSFAVGRTQELIYELNRYYEKNDGKSSPFKNIKVYIDSPMAAAATEVFRNNIQSFDEEYRSIVMSGDDPLDFDNLVFTRSTDESKTLNADPTPKVIISASGMCEAGRIRHHLKHRLWDPKSTVVFVGYQAEGTLGRKLVDGAERVSLFGEEIEVNAEIVSLEGFSAHADRDGLLDWARGFDTPLLAFFLVHGETEAKEAFAETLRQETGLEPIVIDEVCTYNCERGLSQESGAAALAQAKEGVDLNPVDSEEMDRLLLKLHGIGENVDGLLYRARLAIVDAEKDGDMKRYTALKNLVATLESSTSKLAGELAGQGK